MLKVPLNPTQSIFFVYLSSYSQPVFVFKLLFNINVFSQLYTAYFLKARINIFGQGLHTVTVVLKSTEPRALCGTIKLVSTCGWVTSNNTKWRWWMSITWLLLNVGERSLMCSTAKQNRLIIGYRSAIRRSYVVISPIIFPFIAQEMHAAYKRRC